MSCPDSSSAADQPKPHRTDLWAFCVAIGFILLIVAGILPHAGG